MIQHQELLSLSLSVQLRFQPRLLTATSGNESKPSIQTIFPKSPAASHLSALFSVDILHEWDRKKKINSTIFWGVFLAPKPHNRCVDVDLQSESEEQNESIALI